MTRFLHTGDWQLGMTRHFFSEGVKERFTQSRFDAIRELGRIAEEEDWEELGKKELGEELGVKSLILTLGVGEYDYVDVLKF